MNGESAALRDGANGFEKRLIAARAGLDVDHHVRGNDFRDAALDGVARRMSLFEARRARHADGDVHEVALAGAAHAHALGFEHALGGAHGAGDPLAEAARGHVHQRVGGALAEPRADPDNHAGDAQRRHRVEHAQRGDPEFYSQPRARDAENHKEGAPDIGRKMQRVGFERLAGIFFRHALQRARAEEVHSHAHGQNQNRREAGANVHTVEEQPLECFPDDVERGEEEQAGLDERGKALHFFVAVEMFGVRGLFRDANRKVGDDRGDQVQNRMQRFGEDSQAARHRRQENLQ